MSVFYYDNLLMAYEQHYQWDHALEHLVEIYHAKKDLQVLYSLVGFAWLYLVEGPLISREYEKDQNTLPLDIWKRYTNEGFAEAKADAFFSFIAGYTLSLHGIYIGLEYEQKGHDLMENCVSLAKDPLLRQMAENFLTNEHSRKHIHVNDGKAICEKYFDGKSLLEKYFNEIYSEI